MAIYGPFTGSSEMSSSYCYGPHWNEARGYFVKPGCSEYTHRFGGSTWGVPDCPNCGEPYHQIITFDLLDPRLHELRVDGLLEIPLTSCINCSTVWEPQVFKLEVERKRIVKWVDSDKQNWIQPDELKIKSPLPTVPMTLVDMKNDDVPINRERYYENLDYFGKDCICRLLGAPLYVLSPIDRECPICKEEMIFIAAVTGQRYDDTGSVIPGIDFFLGEMILYFMLCKHCLAIKTECQGT